MSGRLSLSLRPDWRHRFASDLDRDAIEARIPDGHFLHVVAVGRNLRLWRLSLHPEGDIQTPVWRIEVSGPCNDAIDFALRKHGHPALRITTDSEGFVLDVEDIA